jgi:prophage regulatory protein
MSETKIYRMRDLTEVVGLPRSSIWALVARDQFPRPVKLSARTSGWRSSDVAAWIAERPIAPIGSASSRAQTATGRQASFRRGS